MSEIKEETVSLFYGKLLLTYPRLNMISSNLGIMNFGTFNIQATLIQFMFYFGTATASLCLLRGLSNSWARTRNYLRSIFNGSKFLTSKIDFERTSSKNDFRYYAVIYGLNRGGYAFAKYLAKKGFNLILIDRDMDLLKNIENSIRKELLLSGTQIDEQEAEEKLIIHKIALFKFDQESLRNALIPVKDLPVKIFVNSKNSKRNAQTFHKNNQAIMDFENENSGSVSKLSQSELNEQMGEDLLSRNEVYFSGRENIEGFSTLVSIFLYQMRREADYPSVINIDNYDGLESQKIKRGQILFEASLAFQDTFTNLLSKKFPDVHTINVRVNFKNLKENESLQSKLCSDSFSYLGIHESIFVK